MREFEYIEAIKRLVRRHSPAGLRVGIGDDAAVLRASRSPQVLSTDCQIEGVHFRFGWLTPQQAARRAVEAALSDLAAMGALPRALLAAIQLPLGFSDRKALAFARGLSAACRRHGIAFAGGNVAAYEGPFSVTLTVAGEIRSGSRPLLRSRGEPGHVIFATGLPGLARLGMEALKKKATLQPFLRKAVRAYTTPKAQLTEGTFLSRQPGVGAVIDLSDGLAGDLKHIALASGVGAELQFAPPKGFLEACSYLGLDPYESMLGPSDDYQLLFTVSRRWAERLKKSFQRRFRRKLLTLGRLTPGKGKITLVYPDGRRISVNAFSFEHLFGSKKP